MRYWNGSLISFHTIPNSLDLDKAISFSTTSNILSYKRYLFNSTLSSKTNYVSQKRSSFHFCVQSIAIETQFDWIRSLEGRNLFGESDFNWITLFPFDSKQIFMGNWPVSKKIQLNFIQFVIWWFKFICIYRPLWGLIKFISFNGNDYFEIHINSHEN